MRCRHCQKKINLVKSKLEFEFTRWACKGLIIKKLHLNNFGLIPLVPFWAPVEDCYFWATQAGAELDLLILKEGKRIGFEIKYTDHPKITPSMRIAIKDLKLDHLYIIFPGDTSFPLDDKITASGLSREFC